MKITIFPQADVYKLGKEEAANKATKGEILEIKTKEQFLEAIVTYTWSSGIFKDNYRKNDNFIESYFIAFDIDEKIPLKETIDKMKLIGYTYLIGTSYSHLKEKNGVFADRYRVILPLQKPISNREDYATTWASLAGEEGSLFYGADTSCKDPARYFFPCQQLSYVKGVRKLEFMKHIHKPTKKIKVRKDGDCKGKISSRTKKFIEEYHCEGGRHHEFVLAVMDLKAQGYSKEEVKDITIPIMNVVKPEERAEFQIDYIFDKYDVDFEYREEIKG